MPRRPAQVLSPPGRAGEHHGALQSPPEGAGAVNLVPTHNPQKAGHCGPSGAHAPRMESKPAVGTVRTWSQGPAPVLATAARAAPALTARFPVGLPASPFSPPFPTEPQLPSLSEACALGGGGGWFKIEHQGGRQVAPGLSHSSVLTQGHPSCPPPPPRTCPNTLFACLPAVILPASSVEEATVCEGKRNLSPTPL